MESNRGPKGKSSNPAWGLSGLWCAHKMQLAGLRGWENTASGLCQLRLAAIGVTSSFRALRFQWNEKWCVFPPQVPGRSAGSPLSHQQSAKEMLRFPVSSQYFLAIAPPSLPALLSLNVRFGKYTEEGREFRVREIGQGLLDRGITHSPLFIFPVKTKKQKDWDKEIIFLWCLSAFWQFQWQDCKSRAGFSNCFGLQSEPLVSHACKPHRGIRASCLTASSKPRNAAAPVGTGSVKTCLSNWLYSPLSTGKRREETKHNIFPSIVFFQGNRWYNSK